MNPIPVTWCAIGGLGLAALGAWGGWTINDWRHDSRALIALEDATKAANNAAKYMRDQGDQYEESKSGEQSRSTVREGTIREIYKDRPVPADCDVPAGVGSVLDDAIATANARRTGEPGSGLSPDRRSAATVP
jgi:hypothetical protein